MLSYGNSNAEITARNLIKISRGEVPYDRIKGVDASVVDGPLDEVSINIENDVREIIEDYEPRVDVKDVVVKKEDDSIIIELNIEKVEEQENNNE